MIPPDLGETTRLLASCHCWTDADANRVAGVVSALAPRIKPLIDDVQRAIARDPSARHRLGGDSERLQNALSDWLRDLLTGPYDDAYFQRRWLVGRAHAESGLPAALTLVARSQLRSAVTAVLQSEPTLDQNARDAAVLSLSRLLDLDLALIDDAYRAALAEKLQRHERLATLGQIAGGIAHELRNPLNVIATSCDYLTRAHDLTPEKRAEHLDRIARQVAIGENVIRALSQFAHMPEPASQPVPLIAIIDLALEVDPPPAGITVQRGGAETSPHVLADAEQLRIALGNVLRNAYEAMEGPGLLVLSVDREGDSARLRVTDSGAGIPPEVIPRLTDPLYSGKPRGLGLGLAITRAILERHRGTLEFNSRPGQGTTVTLTLPALDDGS